MRADQPEPMFAVCLVSSAHPYFHVQTLQWARVSLVVSFSALAVSVGFELGCGFCPSNACVVCGGFLKPQLLGLA